LGISGTSSDSSSAPFFELLSYTGYKFVSLCLIVIAQLVLGNLASYVVLIVTGGMFVMFFYQSVKTHCGTGNSLADHASVKEVTMNRKTVTFVAACEQICMIWILSLN